MDLRDWFFTLSDTLSQTLPSKEVLLCSLQGEDSDFVRINRSKVRQAGAVRQYEVRFQLIDGLRHSSLLTHMTGIKQLDLSRAKKLLGELRQQNDLIEEDPFLNYNPQPHSSEDISEKHLPVSGVALEELLLLAKGLDLVGLFTNGSLYRGFANSLGQKNWQTRHSFMLDWSCFSEEGLAVKSCHSGSHWQKQLLEQRFTTIREQLSMMAQPPVRLKPGNYRAFLCPPALAEIMQVVCWDGFSLKSHKTKQSPLLRLNEQIQHFDSRVALYEASANGMAAGFTDYGFIKPPSVSLVKHGLRQDYLVDPRSAREFGVDVNAQSESPTSLHLGVGDLLPEKILAGLDSGLYISNLWYSNLSDRNQCRITGMTRFACFWVEKGVIQAPIEVMRFDQSLYEILGDKLVDLSSQCECLADTNTYQQRSTNTMVLPGILLDCFRLTD